MRKTSRNRLLTPVIVIVLATSAFAQADRLALRAQQVVDAMQAYGLKASPGQIEFLAQVTAASGGSLRVLSVSKSAGNATIVRLRCGSLSDCKPFYALAHGVVTKTKRAENLAHSSATPKSPVIMRQGQLVSLLMESTNFRITILAICLDNGRTGDVIRLRSVDRKRIYTGRVVDNKTVRGTVQGS